MGQWPSTWSLLPTLVKDAPSIPSHSFYFSTCDMRVETVTYFVFAFPPLPGPVGCQIMWENFIVNPIFFKSLYSPF